MANNKQRYVNTRFWNDSYISQLDPIEKLLFIYFITNEHTNISGIYELPLKIIAVETGMDESMIKKILPRLSVKIRYIDGYIVIKNFTKHQETGSEKVKIGILNCLKDLNKKWLENVVNKGFYLLDAYYMDTLSIQYAKGSNYLDLDSNLDSNSITEQSPVKKVVPKKKEIQILTKSELKAKFDLWWEKCKETGDYTFAHIINIIEDKAIPIANTEQLDLIKNRHIRTARELSKFDYKKVLKAMDVAKKQTSQWTLETVLKALTNGNHE